MTTMMVGKTKNLMRQQMRFTARGTLQGITVNPEASQRTGNPAEDNPIIEDFRNVETGELIDPKQEDSGVLLDTIPQSLALEGVVW